MFGRGSKNEINAFKTSRTSDIHLAISHHGGFGPAFANIFRGSTGRERSRKARMNSEKEITTKYFI